MGKKFLRSGVFFEEMPFGSTKWVENFNQILNRKNEKERKLECFLFFVTGYTLTYVLGSSLIWKCKILNIEYLLLFLQSGGVGKNKTNIQNLTRPNQ